MYMTYQHIGTRNDINIFMCNNIIICIDTRNIRQLELKISIEKFARSTYRDNYKLPALMSRTG